ncbi:hypothetical protein Tco_0956554 [Tanacetum coccineum]
MVNNARIKRESIDSSWLRLIDVVPTVMKVVEASNSRTLPSVHFLQQHNIVRGSSLPDTYNNLFSVKLHYGGRFTDSPNKQYVDGEVCFVDMLDIYDFKVDLLNTFMCSLGYEDDDELLLYYKIPLKIEKTESSGDEDGQSDSESEDANDLVNEEHLVEEVEVNMNKFNFQLDGEDETDFIDHIQSHVNVTEDDLEVLDFDSLESEQEDVPENARSRVLRKLRKKHMSYGIRNNFYIGKEFANRDLAK